MVCASSCFVICHISSACRAEQPRYTTSRDAVQAGASGLRSVATQHTAAACSPQCCVHEIQRPDPCRSDNTAGHMPYIMARMPDMPAVVLLPPDLAGHLACDQPGVQREDS
jgi:hypothetical protein